MGKAVSLHEKKRLASDEKIITAAIDTVAEKGYTGCTVRDIAANAGITPGLIIQRFGSKENLVIEAVHYTKQVILTDLNKDYSLIDAMYMVVDDFKRLCLEGKSVFQFYYVMNSGADIPDSIKSVLKDIFYTGPHYRAMKKEQEEGRLPKGDLYDLFSVFLNISYSMISCYARQNIPFPDNKFFLSAIQYQEKTEQEIARREKINRIFSTAISSVFLLGIYVNLTRNTYSFVQNTDFNAFKVTAEGVFDDLHRNIVDSFYDPVEAQRFDRMCNREAQLCAFYEGKSELRYNHQQYNNLGELHWIQTQIFFFENEDGDACEISLARLYDEEMKQKGELEQALKKSEIGNQMKEDFIFNMSHDIRTPLNAIMGYAEILENNEDISENEKKCVDNIKTSGRYLLEMLTNVLEIRRINSEDVKRKEHVTNVKEIMESVRTIFEYEAQRKQIAIHCSHAFKHDLVLCDQAKVRQVLLNVVSNAIKFNKEGGTVAINALESEACCENESIYTWVIEDTGCGMSEEYLLHIFDYFSKERTMTESKCYGSGLGMSIVKCFMDYMGGTIEIQSKLGVGTKVILKLPLKTVPDQINHEYQNSSRTTGNSNYPLKGYRVLIAEDNELNAEIVSDMMNTAGAEVEIAENGKLCIEKLRKASPSYYSCVVMDIQMPEMNGFQATREIRKLEDSSKAEIPIIALTANVEEADRERALQTGMNGFIEKPVDIGEMMKEIKRVLSV